MLKVTVRLAGQSLQKDIAWIDISNVGGDESSATYEYVVTKPGVAPSGRSSGYGPLAHIVQTGFVHDFRRSHGALALLREVLQQLKNEETP